MVEQGAVVGLSLAGDCPRLSGRLWQELLEVLQQVWGRVEKSRHLGVDILDGFLFPLVRL
jgi:hypothetical protein